MDTPDFPKVGYIAAKADLIIVRLAAVTQDVQVIGEGKTDFKKGEIPEVVWIEQPALKLKMLERDAQEFSALTQKAVGKRVLIMQGERVLMAPYMHVPIPAEEFIISGGAQFDVKGIEAALKRLVK